MPLLLLVAGLVGMLLALVLARAWRRASLRWRFRKARAGELAAEALLRRRGFRILDEQVRRREHLFVDGERVDYEVRADLLVARWWRTYVVEVKTGKAAPNPTHTATRRQLREYAAVYAADGLLLADMNAGTLHEIRFPAQAGGREPSSTVALVLLGALLGVGLTLLL